MAGTPETSSLSSGSTWDTVIWPRWLPLQARLPLIAQIAAAVALMAAFTMPRWSEMEAVSGRSSALPSTSAVGASVRADDRLPAATARPAHLNLDVRHTFRNVELSVTVDGKPALETKLSGSGKRFGVIGKRAERGFTRTIDVAPGARVVRVRLRSASDKFDYTRVERFDLDSAAVASLWIAADKSGLSVVADRPLLPKAPQRTPASLAPFPAAASPQPAQVAHVMQAAHAAQAAQAAQEASALAELYQSLRQILIALAGFIGSAATGFVVQEFMRSRRALIFAEQTAATVSAVERRRRRRTTRPTVTSE